MLENQYGFEFPKLYERLLEDGMLDYHSKNYLLDYHFFGADIEPMTYEDALMNYEDFPFWDKDQSKQIFPIGQTGGGDWYGFCFSLKTENTLPIVLMFHDSDNAVCLADHLEDFIFYKMLMVAMKNDDQCHEEMYKEELQRVLASHKKYLREEYVRVLEDVYSLEDELSFEQLEDIYRKETKSTMFDQEFDCSIEIGDYNG